MKMSKKCGCQDKSQQGTTANTKPDGNVCGTEFETNTGQSRVENGPRQRLSNSKIFKCTIDCVKKTTPRSSTAGDTHSPSRPVKHPSQGCCCAPSSKSIECKPEQCFQRSASRDKLCRCGKSPIRELELEKERRKYMEAELGKLKLQIADMMQSKSMALNMTKQLKQRYEKMKGVHSDTASKLASLERENEFLCRCLEKERAQTMKLMGDSGIQVLNKDIDKSAIKTIQEQDAKIRSLNDSVLSLSKTVEDREFEKKRLEHEKDKIHERLKKNKDMTKKLSETTAKLAKSVRQKHDSFMAIRNKAGKYQKEMNEYKSEVRRSQLELQKLKTEIERQRSRGDSLTSQPKVKDAEALEEKLKKVKEREKKSSETIQLLTQRIRDLECKDPKSLEKEFQHVTKEFKTLQTKYDEAITKIKLCEEIEEKRAEMIKAEMKSFTEDMASRENVHVDEKEKMKKLVEELQSIVEQQRRRIDELEELKQQQDIVIKSQNEQLNSKEEQIRLRERENDLVKEQCLDLDKQVDNLRSSIDQFDLVGTKATHIDLVERIKSLSDQVDELTFTLREEQQKSIMKDKIIEDQFNTIQDMKQKYSSLSQQSELRAQSSREQMERMSRQLAKEKEVSRKTVSNLMTMQKKKEKLERNVEDLEEAYEEFSSISFMENIEKEQQQWKDEKQKLITERDRAIGAAKLATQTLIETMDDFQGQIKSQQKLQKLVTEIITNKSKPCIPPCLRRREMERTRNMQVAIPCRPVMPRCNMRATFAVSDEDGFYTASSGKASTVSDVEEPAAAKSGIFNLLGQYTNYISSFASTKNSVEPRQSIPSTSRPATPSEAGCRCMNVQCQCVYRSLIPLPVASPSRHNTQQCPQCNPKQFR